MRGLTFAIVATIATIAPALAQEAPATRPPLQISVEPLVVRFNVAVGNRASTPVSIRNVGTEPAAVVISPVDWHTTVDGEVRTEAGRGASETSLDAILAISAHEFTLAPGELRTLTMSLAMPDTAATPGSRDRFGGYLVRATPVGLHARSSFGVGADVLAYETLGTPHRHVRLADLAVSQSGRGTVAFVARFLNDGENYVRPQIGVRLARAGRVVRSLDDSTPAIFAGGTRRYKRSFTDLEPGRYSLELTSDYGGATLIDGTTEFDLR